MFGAAHPGRRARVQLILAAVSLGLAVLAALVPEWVEELTGVAPDGGNGVLEWLLPLSFAVAAVVLGGLGLRTRRRALRPDGTPG